MKQSFTSIMQVRRWLKEHPTAVFAQERVGGDWKQVTALKTRGGIIWVQNLAGGWFMPADIKLCKELKPHGQA